MSSSYHLFLVWIGQTTNEHLRAVYRGQHNPYNSGPINNCQNVCCSTLPPSLLPDMSEEIPAEEYLDRNTLVRRREESCSEFNPSEYSGESFGTRLTFMSQADNRNSTSRISATADKRHLTALNGALNDPQDIGSGSHSPLHSPANLLVSDENPPEELMIPVSFDTSHV